MNDDTQPYTAPPIPQQPSAGTDLDARIESQSAFWRSIGGNSDFAKEPREIIAALQSRLAERERHHIECRDAAIRHCDAHTNEHLKRERELREENERLSGLLRDGQAVLNAANYTIDNQREELANERALSARLSERVAGLMRALESYGDHLRDCYSHHRIGCDCGLTAALEDAK